MIAQLREANVPFIQSQVVATQGAEAGLRAPIWVKRPDVHNTQEGDVVFARTRDEAAAALAGLAARGFERAVLQPPVEGDLIKFYGVGAGGGADGGPAWFRWFYHKDQRVAGPSVRAGPRWPAWCARPRPRSDSRSTAATRSPPPTAGSSCSTSTRGRASRSTGTRPRR